MGHFPSLLSLRASFTAVVVSSLCISGFAVANNQTATSMQENSETTSGLLNEEQAGPTKTCLEQWIDFWACTHQGQPGCDSPDCNLLTLEDHLAIIEMVLESNYH